MSKWNFRLVEIDSICRRQNRGEWQILFGLGRVENIACKEENAPYHHFLLSQACLGKPSLTHSYTITPFDGPGKQAFWVENTVGKGEIARNEQFLLFQQRFLSVWITCCHFRQIWNCCLQTLSAWKICRLVMGYGLKGSLEVGIMW